jgi:hypothetical protein
MSLSKFILPSFSKDTPNKISNNIKVSGKNTLTNTSQRENWSVAIADEPTDAKVDGKKMFCVRVEKAGSDSRMMIGFTPDETFDSTKEACFGYYGFKGCGLRLDDGHLYYPFDKHHDIIDKEISVKAKEIIVILIISNNGTKKEIRFLIDGKESISTDVSEYLKGDWVFPTICLMYKDQQVTTIPIDQIKIRTPEIDKLINQQKGFPFLRFVSIADFFRQKYPLLQQHEELGRNFLQQREILFRGLMARLQQVANSCELE